MIPLDLTLPENRHHKRHLDLCIRLAEDSTCLRRRYGAVVTDHYDTVIATGYNGAPVGQPHCTDTNKCLRQELNIPAGERYELCHSIHGEQNALLQAGRAARSGTLYLAGYEVESATIIRAKPCFICAKMIIQSRVNQVIILTEQKTRAEIHNPSSFYQEFIYTFKH